MKINDLENQILRYSSKYKIEYVKNNINNEVMDITINKNGHEFDVYGKFKEEKTKVMTCHLKINTLNGITYSKCSCSMHKESLRNNADIYLCEHLTLAAYKFLEKLKEKVRLSSKIKKKNDFFEFMTGEKKNRICLDINYVLKPLKKEKRDFYVLSINIVNNDKKYFPKELKQFLKSAVLNGNYIFNNEFEYSKDTYYFDKSNENVLEYLYEKACDNQITDNHIIIDSIFIRKFFEKLVGKKVQIYINEIPYICTIYNEKIPLSFTIKEKDRNYILLTQKILPINLNSRYDVYFYNKSIYILDDIMIGYYKGLIKEFSINKYIVIEKTQPFIKIKQLIDLLYKLGKRVSLDEGIIKKISSESTVEFLFYREDSKYLCNPIIISGNKKYNYNEVIEEKNYKNIVFKIESILNKSRFYYIEGKFKFLGDDNEFYIFLKNGIQALRKTGVININEQDEFYEFKDISLDLISIKNNNFYIEGFSQSQFNNIIDAYNNNESFIKTEDGRFIDLSSEPCIKLLDAVNIIGINNRADNFKILYLSEKIKNENDYLNLKENIKNYLSCNNRAYNSEAVLPDSLMNSLKEYQKEGVRWFKKLSNMNLGGILSDDMGLGKTIQTIAFLCSEPLKNTLIVMPASLIYNWKNEINKFAPDLKVGIAYGSLEERINIINSYKDYNIILTSYNTLNNDIEKYKSHKFNYLILDEGQYINNYKVISAKNVRKINAESRFILSGTPVENNLTELWSLFDFILPGLLGGLNEFKDKFLKNKNGTKELKLLISPYILKREKSKVLRMPQKKEYNIPVFMKKTQKNFYEKFLIETRQKLSENDNTINLLSYLTKLRQACLDPCLIDINYTGSNAKISLCRKIISNKISKHKILVFSQYTSILKKLKTELDKEKYSCSYLDGAVSAKDRIKLVNEFNEKSENSIFLISLKAGGTGLNLTSADVIIHFDPWYNPYVESQASDRAHRIGQENDVYVYKLILKNTIEERIIELQKEKKQLIESVINGNNINDWQLNKEEIINIILR